MNQAIQTCRLDEWVKFFYETTQEEKNERYLWEFYLAKVDGQSYNEFKSEMTRGTSEGITQETKEEIVKKSQDILNVFVPGKEV